MKADKLAINCLNFARVRFQLKFAFIIRPISFYQLGVCQRKWLQMECFELPFLLTYQQSW